MPGILNLMIAGGAGLVIPLPGGSAGSFTIDPTNPSASWTFITDGTVQRFRNGEGTDTPHGWFKPTVTGVGSSYWIRATLASGTTPSGTLNTWLQLSSNRSWSLSRSTIGTSTCSLTIEIASDSGGSNIVTSGSYSITVDKDSGA